ncbi:MAG: hypothetical protein ACREVZ_06590 [Burkholderiales bacterium]
MLQSRPETVWSARDPAPLAQAEEAAHHHVMKLFRGGR